MKTTRARLFAGGSLLCLALGGCTGSASPTPQPVTTVAATVSADVLPPQDLANVQAVCNQAQPLLSAATSPGAPSGVSNTASYAASYCAQLKAAPAGTVPATTDSSTPSWLPGALSAIETAAQIAGFVVPLVL